MRKTVFGSKSALGKKNLRNIKKLVPKNPRMQAETIRRRRATGPNGSPSLIKDDSLAEKLGFEGFSETGTGGVAGGFSKATPPDFVELVGREGASISQSFNLLSNLTKVGISKM